MIYKGKKLRQLIEKMGAASTEGGDVWDKFHKTHSDHPAIIILPLGELIRPSGDDLNGTIWAWKLQDRIRPAAWDTVANTRHGLVSQGIEGLIEVETNLMDALLFAQNLADDRCLIKCEVTQ
jgi:hypothetical protein